MYVIDQSVREPYICLFILFEQCIANYHSEKKIGKKWQKNSFFQVERIFKMLLHCRISDAI